MNLIGFTKKYDRLLSSSKYVYVSKDISILTLSASENEMLEMYLMNSNIILSKTLAIYEDGIYIGPYMIFSDGLWMWPSYFQYNLIKEGFINSDFISYLKEKKFALTSLTTEQIKDATYFLEREMLGL
jgi:hypothetical protein